MISSRLATAHGHECCAALPLAYLTPIILLSNLSLRSLFTCVIIYLSIMFNSSLGGVIMFCYKCGKEVPDDADVCLGCGTLLSTRQSGKTPLSITTPKTTSLHKWLSIGTLIFCIACAIVGGISFGFFSTEGFAFRVENIYADTYSVRTTWLVPSLLSSLAVAASGISSVVLAKHGDAKKINISTMCLTALYFIVVLIISLTSL